jgi:ligand-binding SRPBCC domain-containing protein
MIHQIRKEQFLNAKMEDVWDFVTSPYNLKKITPDYMNFLIQSQNINEKIYPGMIICYKVSPILKIPTTWVTEITNVKKNEFFVDEQRVGPYKIWHHQHLFREEKNGVLMIDIVSYKLPFGIIGRLVNLLFIKNKLNDIFNYRYDKMNEIFN